MRDQLALFERRYADLEARVALLSLGKAENGIEADDKPTETKVSSRVISSWTNSLIFICANQLGHILSWIGQHLAALTPRETGSNLQFC